MDSFLKTVWGSESAWFWTMAQAISIAISLVLIFRQVRAQRIANELSTLKALYDRWNSKDVCQANAVVIAE